MGNQGLNNRIAFATIRIGADAMKGIGPLLADREDAAVTSLNRRHVVGVVPSLATILTGVPSLRHQIFTLTVPRLASPGDGESVPEESRFLQFRNSRMGGAPMIWNRLASRGIGTAVVNMPYVPAKDEDLVAEIPRWVVAKRAQTEDVTLRQACLGYVLGTVTNRPDVRCVITAASFVEEDDPGLEDLDHHGDGDVESQAGKALAEGEGDESDDPSNSDGGARSDPAAMEAGRQVISFIDDLSRVTGADHVLVIALGLRVGRVILMGPRASEVKKRYVRSVACVPTILDLLGEPIPADVMGASMLAGTDDSGDSPNSWALDGGDHSIPDWDVVVQRCRDGVATRNETAILIQHLRSKSNAGLFESGIKNVIEETRLLHEIVNDPATGLRLAFMLNVCGMVKEARAQIQAINLDHPESVEADIARLLTAANLESREIEEILDRTPYDAAKTFIAKGIMARAAARAGRDDQAIEWLWFLIMRGQALGHDRLTFAQLAVKRNQPNDASRAALVLRDMGHQPVASENNQPRSEIMMLRARALAASGSIEAARHLLASYLDRHPEDNKVRDMLEHIKTPA